MITEEQKKKRREYMRQWNARNREKVNARSLAHYYKNRKKRIAQVSEYKKNNPEKVKLWAADYRVKHAADISAYTKSTVAMQAIRSKRRYEKNKENFLRQCKDYYSKNKIDI